MKLRDIADMKDYLENRCYCPYEIYDVTGIFCRFFKPDTECTILSEGNNKLRGSFVVATAESRNKLRPEIIYIEHDGSHVIDCVRFDATEHNKEQVIKYINGEIDKLDIDEYPSHDTVKDLKDVLSSCDAVIV